MKKLSSLGLSLVLTLLMTLPLVLGIAVAVGVLGEIWKGYRSYHQVVAVESRRVSKSLSLLGDGTPVIEAQERHESQYEVTLTTLDGQALPKGSQRLYGQGLQSDHFMRKLQNDLYMRVFSPWESLTPEKPIQFSDHKRRQWLLKESADNSNLFYFTSRSQGEGAPTKYLSRNGLSDAPPDQTSCFQNPHGMTETDGRVVFKSGPELLFIDLNQSTVTPLSDESETRWGFTQHWSQTTRRRDLLVQTGDGLQLFNEEGQPTRRYDIDAPIVEYYLTDDERLFVKVWKRNTPSDPADKSAVKLVEVIYELGDDGAAKEVARLKRDTPIWSVPQYDDGAIDQFINNAGIGLMFPEPVVLLGGLTFVAKLPNLYGVNTPSFADNWQELQEKSPWSAPMAVLIGLISAAFCYRRQRRYQAPWTKTWVIVVFLLGPAGYWAWRWHREWPPLEMVGMTPERFDAPEPNGLEVFA